MEGTNFGKKIAKGLFFARMKNKASDYARDPDKLNALIHDAKKKANSKRQGRLKEVFDSLLTLFRMIRAYARREYVGIPWQTLLLVVATVLYFLVPTDLIPDFLFSLGYLDDAALIGWTMHSAKSAIDDFRDWESRQAVG
jgi:uncharacterized membrane protein YkvA (DUF1232 family)